MNVLVVVDSRHGSTRELGEALTARLEERGVTATLVNASEVSSAAGYDGVVLGSAVYTGHWLGDSKKWAAHEHEILAGRPVWLFSSGPIGDPPFPAEEPAEVEGLIALTGAREHRTFPGKLDRSELGFLERTMVTAVHAPEGDYRDWDAVRAYADDIADALLAGVPAKG